MNKILIIDASVSDIRVMSNLLSRAGYAPLGVESIEAGKVEVVKPASWRGYHHGNYRYLHF